MRVLRPQDDVEFSIGPHPARAGWRVLRVSYGRRPDHEARVARALDALVAPIGAETGEAATPSAEVADATTGARDGNPG